jgi:hypothetical protein
MKASFKVTSLIIAEAVALNFRNGYSRRVVWKPAEK